MVDFLSDDATNVSVMNRRKSELLPTPNSPHSITFCSGTLIIFTGHFLVQYSSEEEVKVRYHVQIWLTWKLIKQKNGRKVNSDPFLGALRPTTSHPRFYYPPFFHFPQTKTKFVVEFFVRFEVEVFSNESLPRLRSSTTAGFKMHKGVSPPFNSPDLTFYFTFNHHTASWYKWCKRQFKYGGL